MKRRHVQTILSTSEEGNLTVIAVAMSPNRDWKTVERVEFLLDDSDIGCLMTQLRKSIERRQSRLDWLKGVVR